MNPKPLLSILATSTLFATAPALADDIPSTFTSEATGALPAGLDIKEVTGKKEGTVERVVRWNEGDGAHVAVFASITKEGQKDGATWWSKSLHVATFQVKGDKLKKVQDIIEYVAPCQLDMTAKFIDGSITLTNIDGDDKGELTFGYVTRCAGDVSPMAMKILLLEGKDKFALRGQTRIDLGGGEVVGGDVRPDFKKAPKGFQDHAMMLWNQLVGTTP
jgi:hypothetical protein